MRCGWNSFNLVTATTAAAVTMVVEIKCTIKKIEDLQQLNLNITLLLIYGCRFLSQIYDRSNSNAT